ncbi:hypothetical protein BDN67DRAFT_896356 [Paxillus ammoniavirescens]|nr:hypothetical protein BDN67DRAFT_896356 [Paxillus ammoniavirescens]
MATPTASQLKDEGNALFMKKDYLLAHDKYTEAIAIDGQNAVLYANRSACSFGMAKYVDAFTDAAKASTSGGATRLDSGYAKGWSRRASAHDALMEWNSCVDAWQKSLDALPKTNLTPAELKQKEQYTASLKKAKERLEESLSTPANVVVINSNGGKLPWQVAEDMLPELRAAGPAGYTSSAWVIQGAHHDFAEGIQYMKQLKKTTSPAGYRIVGHTGGLASITNGIMRDGRVFHIDSNDWSEKLNDQVGFECQKHDAWATKSLEVIKQKALQRQKKKGWNDVRPALAVTVRAWIMRTVIDCNRGAPHVAIELAKQTLDLLHWGRQVWKNVSKDDRGAIFEDTFVRGVRVIYLEALMQMYSSNPGPNTKATLDTLLEEATDLLEETLENQKSGPNGPVDPGFVSSFFIYPCGQARAMIAYYHLQVANSSGDPLEALAHYLRSSEQYTLAGMTFPEDDEQHCWYLNCGLGCLVSTGALIELVEVAAQRIREVMPKMQRIWGNSALAKQGRDETIKKTLQVVDDELQLVKEGKKTKQDRIGSWRGSR